MECKESWEMMPASLRILLCKNRFGWEGISLQSDVKGVFDVAPQHRRFQWLDFRRFASSALSELRNEQVVMVFVYWHFNIAAMESLPGKTIKHRQRNSKELVRYCTAHTFQWWSCTWSITGMHRDEDAPAVWKTFISYLLISSRSLFTHSCHFCRPCKSIWQLILERIWRAPLHSTSKSILLY